MIPAALVIFVIPGRVEDANPESLRPTNLEIPGSALSRRPGMTD
jgi:hypothetical protein